MTSFHIAINYISSLSTVWTLPGNVVRAVMGADKLKDCLTDEICKETQNSKPSLPYNCKVQSTEWQRQNNYKDKKGKDKFHLHEKWEKDCQSELRDKHKPESEETGKTGINNSETEKVPSEF